jgi:hypothetical protein
MTRAAGVQVSRKTLRVLVADSTPLTGRLIADALSRDRKLSITDAERNSVLVIASTLEPHVIIT